MPNGNGMGPSGMGPITGRGAGFCAGNAGPGYMNNSGAVSFQRRFNRNQFGRVCGNGFNRTYQVSDISEQDFLKNKAAAIENELKTIKNRLNEIDSETKEK